MPPRVAAACQSNRGRGAGWKEVMDGGVVEEICCMYPYVTPVSRTSPVQDTLTHLLSCRCHRVRPRDVRTANGQDGPVTPLPPFQTRPSGIEGIRLDPEIVWKAGMTSSGASNRLGTAEELFLLGCRPESIEWGKKRCWKGFPLGR